MTESIILRGNPKPTVLVVCDVPSQDAFSQGTVMGNKSGAMFRREAEDAGLPFKEMAFITPCPPMDEDTAKSERRAADHLATHHEDFHAITNKLRTVKLVICLGKYAIQQWSGRPVKITKARGVLQPGENGGPFVLPTYSARHVHVRPEILPDVRADLRLAGDYRASGWNAKKQQSRLKLGTYEWCFDIAHLLKKPPPLLYGDTETRGLKWMHNPGTLTTQLCWEPGHAIMLPFCHRYFPDMTEKQVARLKGQVRKLFAMKKVRMMGHHLKYDLHMWANDDIHVANWHGDTIQMAFAVDENMERKNQADCVKRWVGELAGYSDSFDQKYDKSRMWEVPHDDMLHYGCGDVDSGLRLAYRLYELGQEDKKNWNCYQRVQMPTLRMFFKMERQGLLLDTDALRALGNDLAAQESTLYRTMIHRVPPKLRRKHLDKGLKFSRDEFVRDILFSKDGIRHPELADTNENIHKSGRLIPRIFTEADDLPSVSTNNHMPYFKGVPFADEFTRYEKLTKMQSTYVGLPASTTKEPIKRLKKGDLPKAVMLALEQFFAKGSREFEIVSNNKRWRSDPLVFPIKDGVDVRVSAGGVHWLKHGKATGFWKYLTREQRIHTTLSMDRTVTGRGASSNPNVQNIPKHSEFAPAFRRLFVATPGFKLIEADLSQIELRIAAWMANDRTMLRIFREGGDIHTTTACRLMGLTEAQFNKLPDAEREHKRFLAKAVNFGFIYGQWPEGFQQYAKSKYGIDLTIEDAEEFRDSYFELYGDLLNWHRGTEDFVRKNGFVRSLHGALRRLPSVGSELKGIRNEAVRQAVNSPVQRFASDLAFMGMFRFARDCDWSVMRPLISIHDAVVAEAKIGKEVEAAAALRWYMESVPLEEWFGVKPPLPITSDVTIGFNLKEMEKRKDIKPKRPRWATAD